MEACVLNDVPRKPEVDVTIKFYQKQSFADILQNKCC